MSFPLPGWLWRPSPPPCAAGRLHPQRVKQAQSRSAAPHSAACGLDRGRSPGPAGLDGRVSSIDFGLHLQLGPDPAHGQARPGLGGVAPRVRRCGNSHEWCRGRVAGPPRPGQAVGQPAGAGRQPQPGADRGQPLMHQQDRRAGLRLERGGRRRGPGPRSRPGRRSAGPAAGPRPPGRCPGSPPGRWSCPGTGSGPAPGSCRVAARLRSHPAARDLGFPAGRPSRRPGASGARSGMKNGRLIVMSGLPDRCALQRPPPRRRPGRLGVAGI